MKDQLLAIIKIGRDDGAVQISFSNGAASVFIDFDADRNGQVHYIGDAKVPFSEAFAHLHANADHIEGVS